MNSIDANKVDTLFVIEVWKNGKRAVKKETKVPWRAKKSALEFLKLEDNITIRTLRSPGWFEAINVKKFIEKNILEDTSEFQSSYKMK